MRFGEAAGHHAEGGGGFMGRGLRLQGLGFGFEDLTLLGFMVQG